MTTHNVAKLTKSFEKMLDSLMKNMPLPRKGDDSSNLVNSAGKSAYNALIAQARELIPTFPFEPVVLEHWLSFNEMRVLLDTVVNYLQQIDDLPRTEDATSQRIFVIYGRNIRAYQAMKQFLRSLDLKPWDFGELVAQIGGSPWVGEVVRQGIERSGAIIALYTPDEEAKLVSELEDKSERPRKQARQNVIFETGLALGINENKTIVVTLGADVALYSDVLGRHIVRLNNHHEGRSQLRQRLTRLVGPLPETADWISAGDFESCLPGSPPSSVQLPSPEPIALDAEGSTPDEVTRFAVEIVTRTEARLAPRLRPQKHSRWAGEDRGARYYRLWYRSMPWQSDQFKYQLWLESRSRQSRTLWVGFSMRPNWLDANGYPVEVALKIRKIIDAYAKKESISVIEEEGFIEVNYEIPAPAFTDAIVEVAAIRLYSIINALTPKIEAHLQFTEDAKEIYEVKLEPENTSGVSSISIHLERRAQDSKLDSRAITDVFGMSSNWVSNARKSDVPGQPILEYILDGRGEPKKARDGRFLYKLDRVLEFVRTFEKWVSAKENINNMLPLLSTKDERIVNGRLLTLASITEMKDMPKSSTTVKKRLAPPVAFCFSSAGQRYSLLYPEERLDWLREGVSAPLSNA